MLKLTPSQLREYLMCPRKYRRRYVDKVKEQTDNFNSQALSFGNVLHAALAELHSPAEANWQGLHGGEAPVDGASPLERLVMKHWVSTGYETTEQEQAARTSAVSILEYYLASGAVPSGTVLGVEEYLTGFLRATGEHVELSCRADRVELLTIGEGVVLEVLDYKYKSGSGPLPSATALADDLPTFIYFLCAWGRYSHLADLRGIRVSLLDLVTLRKVTVDYHKPGIASNYEALQKVVHKIRAENFEPTPSAICPWCPFRKGCPAVDIDLDKLCVDQFPG